MVEGFRLYDLEFHAWCEALRIGSADSTRQLVPNSASYCYTLRFRERASYDYFADAAAITKAPIIVIESSAFLIITLYIQHALGHLSPFVCARAILSGGMVIGSMLNLKRILAIREEYRLTIEKRANCALFPDNSREAAREALDHFEKWVSFLHI